MRIGWTGQQAGPVGWLTGSLGVFLTLLGVLLIVVENLLQYVVAGVFIAAGVSLIAAAWRARRHVTYRRVDQVWSVHEPHDHAG